MKTILDFIHACENRGHDDPALPDPELYLYAIRHYTIAEHVIDWADDDTDWGMGYDYNNSYRWNRAPEPDELFVQDGKLKGFTVRGSETHLLEIDGNREAKEDHSSPRYGSGYEWRLCVDDVPGYPRYFSVILSESEIGALFRNPDFTKYVKRYVSAVEIEDARGFASGDVGAVFEFADPAAEDPIPAIKFVCSFFADRRVTLLKG